MTSHTLQRFLDAQENMYQIALNEIKRGRKTSHWMWFIFPQISGLGMSDMAMRYAIKNRQEASAYLAHDILGERLVEISRALLELETNNPVEVFGGIDSMKLRSSMTLFSQVNNADPVFKEVLAKFYNGEPDEKTIRLLV